MDCINNNRELVSYYDNNNKNKYTDDDEFDMCRIHRYRYKTPKTERVLKKFSTETGMSDDLLIRSTGRLNKKRTG